MSNKIMEILMVEDNAADVRLTIIDIAVTQPQRAVRIAVDAAAKYGVPAGDAAVDDGLSPDSGDGALQLSVVKIKGRSVGHHFDRLRLCTQLELDVQPRRAARTAVWSWTSV